MKTICTLILFILLQSILAQKTVEVDLKRHFDKYNVNGCFVLFDQAKNEYLKHNIARCDSGFIPASTFKIPHSLIALEEQIISDTTQIIKWNGYNWPYQAWNKDQNLKSAIKFSCVWFYEEIAKQIEVSTYNRYLQLFNYGNKDISVGSPTRFWLSGSLKISAMQQVDFLSKFYNNEFAGISDKSTNSVKSIIVQQHNKQYKLSVKTGRGNIDGNFDIFWYVGYVEQNNNVYFFAMNYTANATRNVSGARQKLPNPYYRNYFN